jgi:NADPH:quinone reductase-like Zn-dependent oxidoreductase
MRKAMRAVLLTGHGGLEKLEYREDVPMPQPDRDEVFIRVGATGINNTDLWTREGAYGQEDAAGAISGWQRDRPLAFPRIQGADIAGRIVDVGEGVAKTRMGQRVLVNPTIYMNGDDLTEVAFVGSERDGGFAEFVSVPAQSAHKVDTDLTDAELATFPTAYLTAEHMLNRARLVPGETVLITGASGGVGSALVQLAHDRRARILAIVGAGKEEKISELGADAVITRQNEDPYEAIRGIAGEKAVDVVADVVGGPHFGALLRSLKGGGRYVSAGAIANPLVQLDLRTLYLNHLELIGSTLGTQAEFANVLRYIESGILQPLLAAIYPLNEIKQAQTDFRAKRFIGKLVVVP